MTDTPKPLTADEIADLKERANEMVEFYADDELAQQECGETLRLIATIEQQREQIEKLRTVLKNCADALKNEIDNRYSQTRHHPAMERRYQRDLSEIAEADEALAATEPPK